MTFWFAADTNIPCRPRWRASATSDTVVGRAHVAPANDVLLGHPWAFPTWKKTGRVPASGDRAVVLRIEPHRVSTPSGGHPSRGLAVATSFARGAAVRRRERLAGSLADTTQASPASSNVEEPGSPASRILGGGPFPCPGIAGLSSFTLRVNEPA